MKAGERRRLRFAFGALGAVPVFLCGWLGWLQVVQGGELVRKDGRALPLVAATADRQVWRSEKYPAPRGTIVDRNGVTLATDCEAYEVRAHVAVPRDLRKDVVAFRGWLATLVDRMALALVADPEQTGRRERHARHRERLAGILARAFRVGELPATGKFPFRPRAADFLVATGIDRLAVADALHELDADFRTVRLDFIRSFRRVYLERELTHGIVGHTDTIWVEDEHGGAGYRTFGVCGLEALRALTPGIGGRRRIRQDGRRRAYFVEPAAGMVPPTRLHTTLDLELQRVAVRELAAQAESGDARGEHRPRWGALVLVDLDNGDLLAAASWHDKTEDKVPTEKGKAFTPYQSRFEPGSIVKPLVLSYAHQVNALDWRRDRFDCSPNGADYARRIASLGRRRPVQDDHRCGVLDAHGIIVNSSNIGAAMVGLGLSREQWQDYMRAYGFGTSVNLNLPHEAVPGHHPDSFDPRRPLRSFFANSAISFSFGYELEVTPLQVARAYLRMFRGIEAELRLVRGVEVAGEWHRVPPRQGTGLRYRPEVVEAVRAAMADVVDNSEHATGRHLWEQFHKQGIDLHGLVGGKTGTAASRVGIGNGRLKHVRNASFVGFVPAEDPRWLAVCVLQKDGRARFYGGSYAAPPAVKLLLECQRLAERRQLRQEPRSGSGGQTRIGSTVPKASQALPRTPGFSGWLSPVGAGAARDTR